MKKFSLAALFAISATTAANAATTFTVDIGDSCTRMDVTIQQVIASGLRYGCAGQAIEGGAVARVAHKRGVVLSETYQGYVVTWFFTQPEAGAGNVYITASNGVESIEVGASTYQIEHGPHSSSQSSGQDFMKSLDFSKLQHRQ